MDIQRKHKILVVDPESNCRLLDIDSGVFHLIIEFNKPLVYQYHDPLAKDYLTMLGDAFGNMHIYRHIKHVSSNMACYPQEEEDIDMLLETQYGGAAKCFRSSETIFVNSENGEIMSEEESDNSFKIVRNNREMKLSSSSGFQTCIKWQLNYSTFQAFYPLVNQEVRDTIRVFHTLNPHEFYKFCKDFHVQDQHTTHSLKDVKWKLPYDEKSRIQVFDKCAAKSNLKLGEYQSLTVGVEKLEAKGDFIKHLENLRNLSTHENIMDVITGQTDGEFDTFAYQIMFAHSLKQYVSLMNYSKASRTDSDWIKVISGIIKGLNFLHTLKIRHGKLKLHSVFVKENCTPKLGGLAHLEFLSHEVRGNMKDWEYFSADVFDFGIILLNVITKGVHGGDTWEKDILNLENILEQFPAEDEEVKDLLTQVLEQDYTKRPSLQKILQHPMFCDWQSRIDLLGELSDFCELKKSQWRNNRAPRHIVLKVLDDVEGPKVFGKDGWKDIFGNDDILREAQKNRTYPYDYYSLTDLLRIFRNIITHLTEFKANYKDALGNSKQETEFIFRKKYPKLFTIVREVAKLHLAEKFRYHFKVRDADLQVDVNQIKSLKNPYT